jgi:ketosteroid isomerase-like protein
MIISTLLLTASLSMTSTPAAIIGKLFDSFNRHDLAALQAMYAPDARLTSSDFCKPRTGADVTRTYAAMFRAFPDIRDDVDTIIVNGDRAAVRFVSSSRTVGGGFRLKLMTMFRFSRGRIIEDDTIFDTGGRPCEE